MNRLVLVCAFLLCACSHAPVVSDFSEAPWDPMKGSVIPLERAIEGSKETVVVLIHGVGDQCPGYALEKGGWLNNDTAQKFGIRSVSITAPVSIPDSQFLDKRDDPNSSVSYRVAEFIYTPSSGATPRKIKAIEITWSALTQWVKSQQLGYDIPKIKPPAADGSQNCYYQLPPSHPDHPPTDFPYSRPPPTRVTLNRLVKEQVFDRSLADAILYVGDYGVAIQRGVAQALCMAMGGTRHVDEAGGHVDSAICKWPETDSIEDSQKFIFVTHSLGGRVLYDTLLGLTGDRVNPHHSTFSDQGRYSEVRRSRNYVCRMIAHTAGIYMMANQLTLLGLAYDDAKHISSDGPQPYDVQHTTPTRGCGYYEEPEPELLKPDAAFVDQRPDPEPHDTSPAVELFGEVWSRARKIEGLSIGATLPIVAFSDTNDVLTWGVPRWYQQTTINGHAVPIHVANVYVKNATHWLGVAEDPSQAHVGYFHRDEVWAVITCGASNGHVGTCAR